MLIKHTVSTANVL